MTNEPSWDEIFSSQPSSTPPQPAAAPLTRRQLREAEGRERQAQSPEQPPARDAASVLPVHDTGAVTETAPAASQPVATEARPPPPSSHPSATRHPLFPSTTPAR